MRSGLVLPCRVLLLIACAAFSVASSPHPDLAGLLALRASICPEGACLHSWNASLPEAPGVYRSSRPSLQGTNAPETNPCSEGAFDGVYCAWVPSAHGWEARVVSVNVQLQAAAVALDDAALQPGAGLPALRELELLCVKGNASAAALRGSGSSRIGGSSSSSGSGSLPGLAWRQQQQQPRAGDTQPGWLPVQASPPAWSPALQQQPAGWPAGEPWPPPSPQGELPGRWLLAFPRLASLRVTGCGARGGLFPGTLTAARNLGSLVLSRNRLSSTLPPELVQLQRLTVLDLSHNGLSGSLPHEWVGLQQLQYLYLNANNLTGHLHCSWAAMNLRLADLSGNEWQASPLATVRSSSSSSSSCGGGGGGAPRLRVQAGAGSDSSGSSSLGGFGGELAGRSSLWAPRCWLRTFCYQEGTFICLARHKRSSPACSRYVYGSSDWHIDGSNMCDHGGPHLAAIAVLWAAFGTAMVLIWIGHSRRVQRLAQEADEASAHAAAQAAAQPFHTRQWLITHQPQPQRGAEVTLPLLYRPAAGPDQGAGYARPASPSAGSSSMEQALAEGLLPSALETPRSSGAAPGLPRSLLSRPGLGSSLGSGLGLGLGGAGGGEPGSDSADSAGASPLAGAAVVHSSNLAPRRSASARGPGGGGGGFNAVLLLPLLVYCLDAVTDARLVLLWGVSPLHAKFWPSYALLGLLAAPHVLVGCVVHFELLAAACLPPALQAAAPAEAEILPPGARFLVAAYGLLFGAPAWLAYPLILLLLAPGVALLTLLCPLTLLLYGLGLASERSAVRYVQLLQGCAALSEAPGTAVLLTVLFLLGNGPLEWAFLDSSLYYLNVAMSFLDMAVAWWLRLASARERARAQLSVPPAGEWS